MISEYSRIAARVLRAAAALAAGGALSFTRVDAAEAPAGGGRFNSTRQINGGPPVATERSIFWYEDSSPGNYRYRIEVTGLEPDVLTQARTGNWDTSRWQELFAVYTIEPGQPRSSDFSGRVAIVGSYRLNEDILVFTPQFPLQPGLSYVGVLRQPGPMGIDNRTMVTFTAPERPATPLARITNVFPSTDVLPENLLKFYVHFSAPMQSGDIYRHIHLLDQEGREIELPFLEIGEELWDPSMTRVTLLLDPGRIKRGVRPLEEVGSALHIGETHALVIDRDWTDANGRPLSDAFRKEFRVVEPDRTPPDPAAWTISAPQAGSRTPLSVGFDEPIDHALVQRMVRVTAPTGEPVSGSIMITREERQWTFLPDAAWRPGTYALVVETVIEDLAGNNVGKPFDVDIFENVQRTLTSESVTLPFEVR